MAGQTVPGDYTNSAQVTAQDQFDPDSTPNNNVPGEDDQDDAPLLIADVSLLKSISDTTPVIGQTVTFTITVSNAGPDAATNVEVTDILPDGFDYVMGSIAGGSTQNAAGDPTLVWTIASLASGGSVNLTFDAVVVAGQTAPGDYTNSAQVTAQDQFDPDSTPGNNVPGEDDQDDAPLSIADLELAKTITLQADADLSGNISAGDTVVFTLTLTNLGPNTATGVQVVDTLPSGYTYLSDSGGMATSESGGVITWNVGTVTTITPQVLTITAIVVGGQDPLAGDYENYAQVTTSDQFDPDSTPGDDSTTDDDDATAEPPISDLDLNKTIALLNDLDGSGNISAGDTVRFTLTLNNFGPDTATGVQVQDELPLGYTYITDNGGGSTSFALGVVTWNVGTVNVGVPATLTIDATVVGGLNPLAGAYTNYAQVTDSDNFDPDSAPNNDSTTEDDDTTVRPLISDLSLTKAVPTLINDADGSGNISPGDTIRFALTVSNAGPDPATGVVVNDSLPAGYGYVTDSTLGVDYDAFTGDWTVGGLAVGGSAMLTIDVTVVGGLSLADYLNYAQVSESDNFDPDSTPGDDSTMQDDDDSSRPLISDLSLAKSISLLSDSDGSGNISAGDTVQFTITVTNAGPDTATGVQVQDEIPAGYSYLSNSGGVNASFAAGVVTWNVGSVTTVTPRTLTITAQVVGGLAISDYENYAQVTDSDNFDPDSTPGDDSTTDDDDDTVRPLISDLSLTKSVVLFADLDGSGGMSPGDTVQFTVTVVNAGPDTATGVAVTDQLPAGYAYLNDDAGGNYNSGTGVWTIGTLAVGAPTTLNIRATILGGFTPASGAYANYAQVSDSDNFDPDSTPDDDSSGDDDDDTAQPPISDLSLDKSVILLADLDGSGNISAGDTVRFTLTLSNAGPDMATGVQVVDDLPAGFSYLTDNGGGATSELGGMVTWNVGTVNVGVPATLTIDATVIGGLATADYTNYAQVTDSDNFDPDSTPDDDSTDDDDDTTVRPPISDLELIKSIALIFDADGSGNISAGDTVQFLLTVCNFGPDVATGVQVQDQLPAGYSYQSDNGGGSTTELGGLVTWDVGTVNVMMDRTLTINATVVGGFDPLAGDYTNYAQITDSDNFDPDSTPNDDSTSDDDDTSVTPPISDLSLVKDVSLFADNDGSGSITAGDTVQFSISVINSGPDAASGVVVTDQLPSGYGYLSDDGGANTIQAGGLVTWNVGNLAVSGSDTLNILATVVGGGNVAAGDYLNYAQVESSSNFDPDSTPGDDSTADDDDATAQPPISDLSLTKSLVLVDDADGSGNISDGDTVEYTIVLTNAGPDTATGVQVQDVVPLGFTTLPATISGGGSYNAGTRTITWNVASLGIASVNLTFEATVVGGQNPAAGDYTNYVQVTDSDNFDPDSTPDNDSTNEDDDDTVTPPISDLSLNKSLAMINDADGSGGFSDGDTVRFTIAVTNAGPAVATGVAIEDLVPAGYTPIAGSASMGGLVAGQTVTWSGLLIGLTTVNLTFDATFNSGLSLAGGDYTNYVQVTDSDNFDPDSTPDDDSTTDDDDATVTPPVSDLDLDKTVSLLTDADGSGGLSIGDTVQFTLTVTNIGPDTATGVEVTDNLPAGYSYLSDNSGGTYSDFTGIWNVGTVLVGTPRSLTINATIVAGGNPLTGDYSNYAQISESDNYDPDSTPNDDSTTDDDDDSVTPPIADLELSKTGPALIVDADMSGTISYGDTIRYTLMVTNFGPDNATGVRVTDQLPAGLTFVTSSNNPAYNSLTGVWTVGSITAGNSAMLTIDATITATGTIRNTAEVTGSDQFDPDSTPDNGDPAEDDQDTATVDVPALAAIGNRVWLDENGNGVQDAGEDGIANVSVSLTPPAGINLGNGPGNPIFTQTGADGTYVFTNLPDGTYTVTVNPATLPAGIDEQTGDPDFAVDHSTTVTVGSGDEVMYADFGYNAVPPASTTNPAPGAVGAIGDYIWNDADGDGNQDPGEIGLAGITVSLLSDTNGDGIYGGAGDAAAVTTTTDSSGHYLFDDLVPGAYVIQVDPAGLPAGWNPAPTSDPDGDGDLTTNSIVVAPGDVFVNADFGFQPDSDNNGITDTGSTIGDRIFVDADGDGIQDAGEPGIPGVTVNLLDNGGNVIGTTTTNQNGQYQFPNLPAGTYTVVVTDTDNVLGELSPISDPDAMLDNRSTVTVNGTTPNLDQDFGYAPPTHQPGDGLIGNTVFLDTNGSGTLTPGEGLEGVTVYLFDSNNDLIATTVTDENGNYTFGGLDPMGTYRVEVDPFTLPPGVTNTIDPDGGIPDQSTVDLSATGGVSFTQDFGYTVPVNPNTISGTVWNDTNADGTLNEAAPNGLAGVAVTLLDSNGNVIATTTTDGNGNYSFGNVPDGTYTVNVTDQNNVLGGYWHSNGPNDGLNNNSQVQGYQVTVAGGQSNNTADFGYFVELAAIMDFVWDDLDGDGIQDPGEPGIPGVTVLLTIDYPNGDSVTIATRTDGNGSYSFSNLLADEDFNGSTADGSGEPVHTVSVPTPPISTISPIGAGGNPALDSNDPAGTVVPLTQGQTDSTIDFGFSVGLSMNDFDPGFSYSPLWERYDYCVGHFGDDATAIPGGDGSQIASWQFNSLPAGMYQVALNWYTVDKTLRATNSPFTISGNGGETPIMHRINQHMLPGDYPNSFQAQGHDWVLLDVFEVLGNSLTVSLSDDADNWVVADAVRIIPVLSPQVGVFVGASDNPLDRLEDGSSSLELGSTPVGTPITQTFTIKNLGGADMSVGSPVVTGNFGLAGSSLGLPAVLGPGETMTFDVQFNATAAGNATGTVSFVNADTGESPFDFTVTASANVSMDRIIDDGDVGYSSSGNWVFYGGIGHHSDVRYSASGTGADVASWTFNNLAPGTPYAVSATWQAHSNRATNAPYRVYNGSVAPGNLLGEFRVDQRQWPSDATHDGVNWDQLGYFTPTGSTLIVTLADDANGYVIADAVELKVFTDPEIVLEVNSTDMVDGSAIVDFGPTTIGAVPQTRTITVRNVGAGTLTLSPPTAVAGYTFSAFGSSSLTAGQSTTFTVTQLTGTMGSFNGSTAIANNDANENPFNFELRGSVAGAPPQIRDDGDANFTANGYTIYSGIGYNSDVRYSVTSSSGANKATWTFTVTPGTYRVSTTWQAHANRANNAPFSVYNGTVLPANLLQTVTRNQTLWPNDFTANGATWEDLGVFAVTGTTLNVQLTNQAQAGKYVIADAVRVELVSPLVAESPLGGEFRTDVLDEATVQAALGAAVNIWQSAGLPADQVAQLRGVPARVIDLPSSMLGGATSVGVLLDIDAGGHGWYVDPVQVGLTTRSQGQMDLLTVLAHELGHMLGLPDLNADLHAEQLMTESLPAGVRRLPLQLGGQPLPGLKPSASLPRWAVDQLLLPLAENLSAESGDDLALSERLSRGERSGRLELKPESAGSDALARLDDHLIESRSASHHDGVFESLELEELLGDRPAAEEPEDLLSLLAKSRSAER
ncbi:MAG: DUF11 domain-containing protein [Pirellulaceae bacterium]|nr:DUF11 domain-containing protein [Pirellulaceae bacterium]